MNIPALVSYGEQSHQHQRQHVQHQHMPHGSGSPQQSLMTGPTMAYHQPMPMHMASYGMAFDQMGWHQPQQQHLMSGYHPHHAYASQTQSPPPMRQDYMPQRVVQPQSQQLPQQLPQQLTPQQISQSQQRFSQTPISPVVKGEDEHYPRYSEMQHAQITPATTATTTSPVSTTAECVVKTDVDALMRAIQTKSTVKSPAGMSPPGHSYSNSRGTNSDNGEENKKGRRRYDCAEPGCGKSFYQKTHLEIHIRSHTGLKPFVCKQEGCGQRFSQLGNLKTHERRHTGERPYACDKCGKTFAQRGNVRAHRIVHEQLKPFLCRLDNCGKQFTQLGNLKSHQNKFHSATLQSLTDRFVLLAESGDGFLNGPGISSEDRDLLQYFMSLYKNANKGIKGRGKDRKIMVVRKKDGDHKSDSIDHQPSSASSNSVIGLGVAGVGVGEEEDAMGEVEDDADEEAWVGRYV